MITIIRAAAIGAAFTWMAPALGEPAPFTPWPDQQIATSCCKTCRSSQPCGDSCISKDKVCQKPPGCACGADGRPPSSALPPALPVLPVLAGRESFAGPARVVDGDTLEIQGEKIRLHGIDAPERKQTCLAGDGKSYRCGEAAVSTMNAAVKGNQVECKGIERDRYRRLVAVCRVGGQDLNAMMVRMGWALAYRKYSWDYVPQESEAESQKRGMWAGSFAAPWDWRKSR